MPSRRRLFQLLVLVVTPSLGAVGVEGWARSERLDLRQGTLIRATSYQDGSAVGVDYLPGDFAWVDGGFETAWGRCDLSAERTWLVFGDSTTRQGWTFASDSWPGRLETPGVQLCVIAENGYHPRDYRRLLEGLAMQPERVVVLLCANDLGSARPRTGHARPDGVVELHEPPKDFVVWAPLYYPSIFERSEAFRFVHWRLGSRYGAHSAPAPGDPEHAADALAAMATQAPLDVFFLARLDEPTRDDAALAALEERSGLVVSRLVPPHSQDFRRAEDDDLHINRWGHAWVAGEIQAALDRPGP